MKSTSNSFIYRQPISNSLQFEIMRKEEELKRLLTETEMLSKQSELIKHDVCLSSLTAQLSSLQLKM